MKARYLAVVAIIVLALIGGPSRNGSSLLDVPGIGLCNLTLILEPWFRVLSSLAHLMNRGRWDCQMFSLLVPVATWLGKLLLFVGESIGFGG